MQITISVENVNIFAFFISFVVGVNIYVLIKVIFSKNITRLTIAITLTITMVLYTMPILLQYKTQDPLKDEKREKAVLENPYIHHLV